MDADDLKQIRYAVETRDCCSANGFDVNGNRVHGPDCATATALAILDRAEPTYTEEQVRAAIQQTWAASTWEETHILARLKGVKP